MSPERFVFRQVCQGTRVIQKIGDQSSSQILPAMKTPAHLRIKNQAEQVNLISLCDQLPHLKEHDRGIIPGMQEPEPIQRMSWIGGIVDQQARQLSQIEQGALELLAINKLASQGGIGCIQLFTLLVSQFQSAYDILHHMG